jgi:hypothetical protein
MAGIAFHSVVDTVQEKLALQANLELGRGMFKDMTIKLFKSKTTHTVTHRKARDNSGLTWVCKEEWCWWRASISYALRQLKSPFSNINRLDNH